MQLHPALGAEVSRLPTIARLALPARLGVCCCFARRTRSYVRSCARCFCDSGPQHSPSPPVDYPRESLFFLRGALNPRDGAVAVYVLGIMPAAPKWGCITKKKNVKGAKER